MTTQPTFIRCGLGLSNRVAAMANALSRYDSIEFSWRINEHCSLALADVFPNGIPGVTFVENAKPGHATHWGPRACHLWDSAFDRSKATAAYRVIMDSMSGDGSDPEPFALCSRFHFGGFSWDNLIEKVVAVAAERGISRVFLLSDSHRGKLAEELAGHGIESVYPSSIELVTDFDRTRDNQLLFLSDWKRLSGATIIVANPATTGLISPARSFGATIIPVASSPDPV